MPASSICGSAGREPALLGGSTNPILRAQRARTRIAMGGGGLSLAAGLHGRSRAGSFARYFQNQTARFFLRCFFGGSRKYSRRLEFEHRFDVASRQTMCSRHSPRISEVSIAPCSQSVQRFPPVQPLRVVLRFVGGLPWGGVPPGERWGGV